MVRLLNNLSMLVVIVVVVGVGADFSALRAITQNQMRYSRSQVKLLGKGGHGYYLNYNHSLELA